MYQIGLALANQPLIFFLSDPASPDVGVAGQSPIVELRKLGGVFDSAQGAVTEIGGGFYQVAGDALDSNTLGPLILSAAASPYFGREIYQVIARDPLLAIVPSNVLEINNSNTAATNAFTVFGSDFASNYNTTLDRWYVDVRSINEAPIDSQSGVNFNFFFRNGGADTALIADNIKDAVITIGDLEGRIPSVLLPGGLMAADVINIAGAPAATFFDALPTGNENADALLDRASAIEANITPRGTLRALLAALVGQATGGNTLEYTFKNPGGTVNRVVLTVDPNGNRTLSTLNL